MSNYLLIGENFKLEDKNSNKINYNDNEINEKYDEGKTRIVTEQARYPLTSLLGMFRSMNYNLQPDFQRRKRWSNEKKSKLIESFIINVPIPPIFLYETDFAHYEVMDGLQRISTICDFYENKFSLENLDEWPELNGRKYEELPQKIKEGIDRRYLSAIILLKETAKTSREAEDMKKLVFERLNNGGVKLTSQETRNALYNGKFNDLCITLSKEVIFRKLWGIPLDIKEALFEEDVEDETDETDEIDKKRQNKLYKDMGDVELIVRFFAYRHLDKFVGKLDKFLDKFTVVANSYSDDILEKYNEIFTKVLYLANDLFGDKAFKMYKNKKWSTESYKIIYDSLMQALSRNYEEFKVIDKKKNLLQELEKFYNKNKDFFYGKNTSKKDVQKRIELFDEFLRSKL